MLTRSSLPGSRVWVQLLAALALIVALLPAQTAAAATAQTADASTGESEGDDEDGGESDSSSRGDGSEGDAEGSAYADEGE